MGIGMDATIWHLTVVESDQIPSIYIRVMLDPVWSGLYPLQSWQCVDLYSDMIHIDHSPCHYRYGAASLWPVATVPGSELHYICIKKTWYEYEVVGGSQSWHKCRHKYTPGETRRPKVSDSIYQGVAAYLWPVPVATVAGAETLYIYKEDLLWVWMEWGTSIIRTNRYPPPIPTTSTLRSQIANIRVWRHTYGL